MSLETWKAEFYPTEAHSVQAKRDPIEHSLRKWEGLKKANMKRHGVAFIGGDITDSVRQLSLNSYSCALCKRYINYDYKPACRRCPIYRLLGRDCEHEYHQATQYDNIRPMLRLLRRVKAEASK